MDLENVQIGVGVYIVSETILNSRMEVVGSGFVIFRRCRRILSGRFEVWVRLASGI